MYTRSYYGEENKITVPENYDGNAFIQESEAEDPKIAPMPTHSGETKISPREEPTFVEEEDSEACAEAVRERGGFLSSVFKKLPLQGLFSQGGIFNGQGFKIGGEEILIIALAIFLFFSRDGDRECALILLLLLFIN